MLRLPVWPSTPGRGLEGPFFSFLGKLSKEPGVSLPCPGGAMLAPSGGRAMCSLIPGRRTSGEEGCGAGKCMQTFPNRGLWWNKVQTRLRPRWDGKAHSVFPKQQNGDGTPDRAWDLASSLWRTERLSWLPTFSRQGYRAGVLKSGYKKDLTLLTPGRPTFTAPPPPS